MEKSMYTDEYEVLVALLVETRKAAGVTQVDLAERLGQSQSFVSKVERGDRRLDVVQLRTICGELGTTLMDFVQELEQRLSPKPKKRR